MGDVQSACAELFETVSRELEANVTLFGEGASSLVCRAKTALQ